MKHEDKEKTHAIETQILIQDVKTVLREAEKEAKKELHNKRVFGEKILKQSMIVKDAKWADSKNSDPLNDLKKAADQTYIVKSFDGLIDSLKELDRIIKAEPKEPPDQARWIYDQARWIYDQKK